MAPYLVVFAGRPKIKRVPDHVLTNEQPPDRIAHATYISQPAKRMTSIYCMLLAPSDMPKNEQPTDHIAHETKFTDFAKRISNVKLVDGILSAEQSTTTLTKR